MTNKELILNFVYQYRKPFNVETIGNMVNLEPEVIEPIIVELLAENTIKLICSTEPIYVRSNRYNPVVGYNQKGEWRFDPLSAASLLDIVEKHNYLSIRAISKDFGLSRQWVHVYMEALASIGIIGFNEKGYCVMTKDNLQMIGTQIKPGILKELKEAVVIEKIIQTHEVKVAKRNARNEARDRWLAFLLRNGHTGN